MKVCTSGTRSLLNCYYRWTRHNRIFATNIHKLYLKFPYVESASHAASVHIGSKDRTLTHEQVTETLPPKIRIMEKCVKKMPLGLQPYLRLMRLDKPTGTWLLLWPCFWSLGLATPAGCLPDLGLMAFFATGAIFMRGAGCTINDMLDKDFDAKVARTKTRPLASGELTTLDAWMFLGGQLSVALLVLLQTNWYTILLGTSSLALIGVYPLVKRVSYWPQLVLGFTLNWGALVGWAAVHGYCNWSVVLPLYFAGISWTLIYDTIYAHQDKVDDLVLKIKSTALRFGEDTKSWLSCFALTSLAGFITCGYTAQQTWPYFVAVALSGGMYCSQIASLDIHDPKNCWEKFRSNQKIGWIIFLGIVSGTLLKSKNEETSSSLSLEDSTLLDKTGS